MCGINGIFHFNSDKKINHEQLVRMRDSLEHRGPDDKGLFFENNIGLGHRRLSILDLSIAGNQPFHSQDGRYIIVYNGEIYNYKDFYPELQSHGFNIKTATDTEVLLKLYQLYGLKILHRLSGMFAFVIWDKIEQKLVAVRDRMGVKPLYYTVYKNTFYFASEQKAIFTAGVPLTFSQNGMNEYIFNRFVAGENTLYENIYKVLPGHSITVHKNGKISNERWWNLKEEIQNHSKIINPTSWFQETFEESIRLRMVSDVPVGVLLSGGLDSSSILATLHDQKFSGIQSFNIGFKEIEHNETPIAQRLSNNFNYPFHIMKLENCNLYEKLISATIFQDEPITHLSEPHILGLAQLAKPFVKVLLSGEGADELMGGYVRYKPLQYPSMLKIIAMLGQLNYLKKRPRLEKLARYAQIKKNDDLVLYNGSNIYPKEIQSILGISSIPQNEYRKKILEEAKSLYPNNLQRQALYFDQHTYLCSLLDRNDRCTMGASIECREPFLDQKLITGMGTLEDKWLFSGKKSKYILKTAMSTRLPKEIIDFKKIGLSVPWSDYLIKSPQFIDELNQFSQSELFKMPYFENIDVQKLVSDFRKGNKKMAAYIIPLLMIHIWQKNYVTKF